jgi:hypothetical protein
MIKFKLKSLIPEKLGNKLAMFYENWFIPPQNESMIEIKKREFKERTKYLDPKILYTLSEDEKKELRDTGYFVDLDEKTIKQLKNYKLTYNRHAGKYNAENPNYNQAFYNTRYYYSDQNLFLLSGDTDFFKKMWRKRSFNKSKIIKILLAYIFLNCFYMYKLREHNKSRKKLKKIYETNPEKFIPFDKIP